MFKKISLLLVFILLATGCASGKLNGITPTERIYAPSSSDLKLKNKDDLFKSSVKEYIFKIFALRQRVMGSFTKL